MQALPNDEPCVLQAGSATPPQHRKHLSSPTPNSLDPLRGASPAKYSDFVNSGLPNNSFMSSNSYNGTIVNSVSNNCVQKEEKSPISEVNFQYLKHVVLKFMLSRETEVGICRNLN